MSDLEVEVCPIRQRLLVRFWLYIELYLTVEAAHIFTVLNITTMVYYVSVVNTLAKDETYTMIDCCCAS